MNMHIFSTKNLSRALKAGFILLALLAPAQASASNAVVLSGKITGPRTVTLVFSEPVYASPGDFTGTTGSLSGKNVAGVSGSGTNTIVLSFDGFTFAGGASAGIAVSSGVRSVGDNSKFIPTTISITDGQVPVLTSLTISSSNSASPDNTFSGRDAVVMLSFTSNKKIVNPTAVIANHQVQVTGVDNGPFTASYVLTQSDAGGTIPITINLTDESGNTAKVTTGFVSGIMPAISSITSNASGNGPLGVGAQIRFTLVPNYVMPGGKVSGSYNGEDLWWGTSNGGLTYTATYTVTKNSPNQTFPLQISGVTLTDQNGNVSLQASGSDVGKFVDTNYSATAPVVTTPAPAATSTPAVPAKAAAKPVLFTAILKNGSTGAEVKALQAKLQALGFFKGPLNGTFGDQTEAALKKFQAKNGLDQVGVTGPATRALLNK